MKDSDVGKLWARAQIDSEKYANEWAYKALQLIRKLVEEAAIAIKWETIANLPNPSHPGSCILGVTPCDGICRDRANVMNLTDENWRNIKLRYFGIDPDTYEVN